MGKCLVPLRLLMSSFGAAVMVAWLCIFRLVDLLLLLHPPTSNKYRKMVMNLLKGGLEDKDFFMKNIVSWKMVAHFFKMALWHSYHGVIQIGDFVDFDSRIHMIKDGCVTRTCPLFDLVKPGRLLLLNLGSTT